MAEPRQPSRRFTMPSISLTVRCLSTQWGESVAVMGSWNLWDKCSFTLLTTSANSFPLWTASVAIPPDLVHRPVQYKYVITNGSNILRWETDSSRNRVILASENTTSSDDFGHIPSPTHSPATSIPPANYDRKWMPVAAELPPYDPEKLDTVERALVQATHDNRSWRQRLLFVRSLFTDEDVARDASFDCASIYHLATLAVYLNFISTGQIRCDEDGGHHRPNHHAREARQIDAALAALVNSIRRTDPAQIPVHPRDTYIALVIRKIFPNLPSYSAQFTVSVPLTRIRDIAHRSDIPRDLKLDIKHNLQNKLHRCAGPEDLHTSARILNRISHGGFSQPFVEQFQIFHAELQAFFNASSLDDRLRYLQQLSSAPGAGEWAARMLDAKTQSRPALEQLGVLTKLRQAIADLPAMHECENGSGDLPGEDVQKTRLVDIDLESYAFVLLSAEAKECEAHVTKPSFDWPRAMHALTAVAQNMRLSVVTPTEFAAQASELRALAAQSDSALWTQREVLLRCKAQLDRMLRAFHALSMALSEVYGSRAKTLGNALGVESQAVAVFAEAEIRANVAFQGSRVADACMRACRKQLALPPWDPLLAGQANGDVMYADQLADVVSSTTGDIIVICRHAEGDENIPVNVRGVVLGRSLPHLSHLGVRARQADVVFVCADDSHAFDSVWNNRQSGAVTLRVTAREGLASLSKWHSTETNGKGHTTIKEARVKPDIRFDVRPNTVIPISKATKLNASSKCSVAGKLATLATESGGLFQALPGVALPHGVFQRERKANEKRYATLLPEYEAAVKEGGVMDGRAEKAARALADFIVGCFTLRDDDVATVQKQFAEHTRVMIRSSANVEDLETMSGAGLYESIANVDVSDGISLQAAVKNVWASLWTKRAASSRASYGVDNRNVSMAVLIQPMVRSKLSFIAFSKNPVTGSEDVYVEVAVGMGETLASGGADGSPYRFRVDRKSFTLTVISFASYSKALLPESQATKDTDGLRKCTVDYSGEIMTTNDRFRWEVVSRIAQIVLLLEKAFDGPQDVEGAITLEDGVVRVFVVQARPQIL